jgi:hypothetical protein
MTLQDDESEVRAVIEDRIAAMRARDARRANAALDLAPPAVRSST